MITALFATISLFASLQEPAFPKGPLGILQLTDTNGAITALNSKAGKAIVLLFVAVDCPISNRYAPEIARIVDEYGRKRLKFFRVYVDASVTRDQIAEHGKDFSLRFPAVLDDKHDLVRKVGASVTPQAAVIGADGTLLYRGRIDDLYSDHGRFKERATRQDLRVALDEILAGKPVTEKRSLAIGCSIPDFP
ncbi:MAG: redoxin domain-containing protein [Armatimonadetes bacterium]|nr:redoxin domain-containing protein [Armatimonadota bacterium]